MKFTLFSIITFIKKSPEKLISRFLLTIFIVLSSYLVITWPGREATLPLDEIVDEEIHREPVVKAVISVDVRDLLIRKPVSYYHDLKQRNLFDRLPEVAGLKKIDENDNDNELYIPEHEPDQPDQPKLRLIYRGMMGTSEGPIAFIDDGRETHVIREGEEIAGWKIIKIDREEVKVYNEKEGKELLLPLGGGPEEEERLRREAEERRERIRERPQERPLLEEEFPPWLEEEPPLF